MESFMKENTNQCMMRPMEEMTWWAMILSNLCWGLVIALILSWANISDFMGGLKAAAMVGLLICASFDLSFYAMSTMFSNSTAMIADIAVGTFMNAVGGGVIGWWMGRGKAAA